MKKRAHGLAAMISPSQGEGPRFEKQNNESPGGPTLVVGGLGFVVGSDTTNYKLHTTNKQAPISKK